MQEAPTAASSDWRQQQSSFVQLEQWESPKAPTTNRHRGTCLPRTLDRRVEGLRDRVVRALVSLGYPTLTTVKCDVAYGRVILSGELPSYHLKQMAQVAALRVAGPGRVDNQVVVTAS
jgi:hypothetical protein